jgi:hypothetical protein
VNLTLDSEVPNFWWEWSIAPPGGRRGEKFYDEETRRKFANLSIPAEIMTSWVGVQFDAGGSPVSVNQVRIEYEIPPCTDAWLTSCYSVQTVLAVPAIHIVSYKWVADEDEDEDEGEDEGVIMTDTRWRGVPWWESGGGCHICNGRGHVGQWSNVVSPKRIGDAPGTHFAASSVVV